ncbi:NYN domain-containing protein [Altererythrobacter sp.]|uniref:NYN domain-containing protein n=1 Tax=Altererythrobacter sp. TaxID=1872480 RepID=UPI001B1BE5CA|nr:NYN domain-containing protein [Altererythrobacter sp.]MBO6608307.1 NYN domain-containing protein [Altererythrobacter sp.]MBO6641437.1 NYN domain-containing protein [Altererythrobacter sp.]MBO6707864.1 NYN domain-containing protein [Altererythrobacter sp.]MBO6946004.1 NYN domain-containing protein [Altererythrobacter sp.]
MSELKNIALLIDADNTTPDGIDPVLTVMAELGQVNIRRAYGNFAKDNLARWDKITNKFGIRPQQQFDVSKGKNATDMAMTIDAIDLLYQGKVDGFGIMTSDSDFTPLVTRLRQDGIVVYGFGEAKTPQAFKSVCTRFIEIKKLIANYTSEFPVQDAPDGSAPATQVDDELMDLITAAYSEAKRDEKGFANLSQLGQIAGNRSSFDVRNYGYKSLNEMFATLDNFKLERRDNQVFVKRLR